MENEEDNAKRRKLDDLIITPTAMVETIKDLSAGNNLFSWIQSPFPKQLVWHERELKLRATDILYGLRFEFTYYAPRPDQDWDGTIHWNIVEPYNGIYMRKDEKGNLKDPNTVYRMNSGHMWVEDRWFLHDECLEMNWF